VSPADHTPVEAPLSQRLGMLQLVRLASAAVAALGTVLLPQGDGGTAATVAASAGAYAAVTTVAELIRRTRPRQTTWLVWPMLLADGLWMAAVVTNTGGVRSMLAPLVPFHVVAVTLLVSHRTGLRVALWHAALLVAGHAALRGGVVALPADPSAGRVPADPLAAFAALSFLLFAAGAAAFSSLNERALRRSRSELASLVDLGSEVEHARTADEILAILARHATRRLGASRAVAAVADGDGVRAVVASGPGGVLVETSGRPLVVPPDVELRRRLDARLDGVVDDLMPDAHNVVVVPLVDDADVLGLLAVEWGGGARTRLHGQTVDAIHQAASHAALALRGARLLAEVERLASRDGLTGVLNRRAFDAALVREVARVARTGAPLSLVLLDLDHFKRVNDTFGHPTGDGVLRQAGQALAETCREVDVAARYGGEEFAVLLPGCSGAQAVRTAERLRAAVAGAVTAVPVTVSAGVATVPVNAADAAELLAAADDALYQSKRAGRDRTTRARRRLRTVA
jgi:two-component system cell cycle response regulator